MLHYVHLLIDNFVSVLFDAVQVEYSQCLGLWV